MEEILLSDPALSTVPFEEWMAELFDRQHARLHRLAARLSGDSEEARDLVQEAFLRAARHPGSVPRDPSRAEAWLVRTLVNLCRDRRRRMRVRRPASLPEHAVEPGADPEPSLLAAGQVREALAALGARRRAVVVLHDLEERPVAEVARLLGIGAVTVRWHLSRARREMKERLQAVPGGTR